MKLLIYGLDGGDLEIMRIFKNSMPFFTNFLNDNESIHLNEDLLNRGWAEILTGVEGKDNKGFYMAPKLDGTHQFSTSFKMQDLKNDPDIVPLWKLVDDRNINFCIMNVPTTTPAPKVKNGIVVGSAGGGLNKIVGIPEILVSDEKTRKFLEAKNYIVDIRIPNDEIETTVELFEKLNLKETTRTSAFVELCKSNDTQFGFLVNRGNTIVEYLARNEIERYKNTPKEKITEEDWMFKLLENHFSELDKQIQTLFEQLQPEHFIITADHNIIPSKYWANINPFLIENQYLALNKAEGGLKTIKTIIKKILGNNLSNLAKKTSPELINRFSPYSWDKSLAFGSTYIPGIFINDKERFNGPVNSIKKQDKLIKEICIKFNSLPNEKRIGMKAVPYRVNHLNGKYSDYLPDIKLEGSEGIFFDERGSSLIWENKNFRKVTNKLNEVNHAAFSGDKGPNPICVMSNKTIEFIEENDKLNLTLIYKLADRILK